MMKRRENMAQTLPMVDAFGRVTTLQPQVTYKLRVKNGYILVLRPNQEQYRLPNLLTLNRSA
ncbi:hypothetical protein FD02_GL000111 [Lacticaseibacillus nasuensis JCM 17158]|uniref:Uncharacterized protein n=2 Tax=Lacticaseibacillus TaxID=2759736 RepID=A0A0R1JTQ5_9LACO|nr:hypothetical protein FD02_GL000111 [Lacticaseibacillus nasuensis JCM 17158]